jgi:hypothetical protein
MLRVSYLVSTVMLVVNTKQFHAECHILLSSVLLAVIYARQLHAEYCLF